MLPLRDNVPTRSFPYVTLALIGANLALWLWELGGGVEREVLRYGWYPCAVVGPCVPPATEIHRVAWPESAFSSMFLHAGWLHVLGNMLFLAVFGKNVEDAFGRARYLAFYFAGGFAAMMTQTLMTLVFGTVAESRTPNLGASGAIAAVLNIPNPRMVGRAMHTQEDGNDPVPAQRVVNSTGHITGGGHDLRQVIGPDLHVAVGHHEDIMTGGRRHVDEVRYLRI